MEEGRPDPKDEAQVPPGLRETRTLVIHHWSTRPRLHASASTTQGWCRHHERAGAVLGIRERKAQGSGLKAGFVFDGIS